MPTKTKKPAPKVSSKNNRPQRATATTGQKTEKNVTPKSENGNDSRLEEFFHDELKDIYWAEKHLLKVLPKMAKAATSNDLKEAFTKHLKVTEGHVQRLEQVFEIIGQKPQAKKCEAMAGITKEGDEIITDTEKGTSTRDVGLIFAGQKVEHYEMATYGGLAQLAKTLGYNDAANILNTTLSEEKEADEGLTGIAENTVNQKAEEE